MININIIRENGIELEHYQEIILYVNRYYINLRNHHGISSFGEKSISLNGTDAYGTFKKLTVSKESIKFAAEQFKNYMLKRYKIYD